MDGTERNVDRDELLDNIPEWWCGESVGLLAEPSVRESTFSMQDSLRTELKLGLRVCEYPSS